MWIFVEVARIECNWGQWSSLITLSKEGVPESFWYNFDHEPTIEEAAAAGATLAGNKNAEDAAAVAAAEKEAADAEIIAAALAARANP